MTAGLKEAGNEATWFESENNKSQTGKRIDVGLFMVLFVFIFFLLSL